MNKIIKEITTYYGTLIVPVYLHVLLIDITIILKINIQSLTVMFLGFKLDACKIVKQETDFIISMQFLLKQC